LDFERQSDALIQGFAGLVPVGGFGRNAIIYNELWKYTAMPANAALPAKSA
jgi:hypothetical protein